MFLHFYAFEHLIRGSQPEFLMVRSGLKRVLSTNFRKLSNGCFLINYGEPLYKHISKLKYFPNPLDVTQQKGTQSISCCMWFVTRSELVKKE